MQAVILAAGTGSRLGKYTQENTKCMLQINHKPLISYILEILDKVGITKLTMVVGYQKENLQRFLGTRYKNVHISYIENPIYDKTNNIYSLYLAREILKKDDTILLESDLLLEEKIFHKLLRDPRKSLAVVDKYQAWMDGTSVILDENDKILDFFPKELFRFQDVASYYKTVNIYKFSKEFSANVYLPFLEAYVKVMGDNEYYESVLRVLTNTGAHDLYALKLDGEKWYEIDDIQDKANAEIIFAETPEEKLRLMQKRYGGYWRFPAIKDFCYLVNPYFPPTKMQEEMKTYFYDLLSQYPSGLETQQLLIGKLFDIEPEYMLVGNGASELIKHLSQVIDGTFGIIYPTFNEYPETIGEDRIVKYFVEKNNFRYSKEELRSLSEKVDNLLLINPDNPSGNYIDREDIITLAEHLLKHNKYFIVDESFIDFAENGEHETLLTQPLLDKYPNLVVIKSISKSYGVPGLRLGVLATSNKNILSRMRQEIPIWNINSFAEFFLQIIGKYKTAYQESCTLIRNERDRLYHALQTIDYLSVIPSEANYFLAHVTKNFTATELSQLLLDKYNIFIKDLTGKEGFGTLEYVRIAVRDKTDNDYLVTHLKKLERLYA